MASIVEQPNAMTMPKGIQRGNPFPLDISSVWYSYDSMAAYASSNPTAYVGQILSLVDKDSGESTAYIVSNTAGDLVKIGTGSSGGQEAVFGDNKTIIITDSVISLKDWKTQFYRWDAAIQQYILTQVSESQPWPANLVPRVDDSGDALAWYEEHNEDIEEIKSTIGSIAALVGSKEDTSDVDSIYGNIKKLEEEKLSLSGGTLTGPLILQDGSAAASETMVAAAVANAGTLKREVVQSLPAVEDADVNTIYMVQNDSDSSDDKYNEYMLINDSFELIGSTDVDLSNYITKISTSAAGNLPEIDNNGALINSGIVVKDLSSHLVDKSIHITDDERTSWNAIKALAEKNEAAIAAIPVLSDDQVEKLATIPAISSIGAGLQLDSNGTLIATGEGASGYVLPIATKDILGGVKSSSEITVDIDTGAMAIGQVSVHKLYIPDGDEFVLYGGTSNY